jgi:hypothetical protein
VLLLDPVHPPVWRGLFCFAFTLLYINKPAPTLVSSVYSRRAQLRSRCYYSPHILVGLVYSLLIWGPPF